MKLERGERLALYRRRQGLTQADLAETLGIQQNEVSEWETGKKEIVFADLPEIEPDPAEQAWVLRRRLGLTIQAAAQLLGVSHVTIIGWEKEVCTGTGTYLDDLKSITDRREVA